MPDLPLKRLVLAAAAASLAAALLFLAGERGPLSLLGWSVFFFWVQLAPTCAGPVRPEACP